MPGIQRCSSCIASLETSIRVREVKVAAKEIVSKRQQNLIICKEEFMSSVKITEDTTTTAPDKDAPAL